jgi:hypothetical protein
MSKFFTWLKGLLAEQSYQDSLNSYIASKNPSTAAEVEHWIRQYDQNNRNGGWAL